MTSIQEFVVQGGQAITAGEVDTFRRQLALYKLKAETLEAAGQSRLRERTAFLLRFVEDVLDDEYVTSDFAALPEAIFAVRYVAKGVDIIPDSVPGLGYSDDAAVVNAVFTGHEAELAAYCAKTGLDFNEIA